MGEEFRWAVDASAAFAATTTAAAATWSVVSGKDPGPRVGAAVVAALKPGICVNRP